MIRSFVTLLLAAGLVGCAGTRSASTLGQGPAGITVAGHGEADAAPDHAVLTLGVEVRRATMAEARDVAASLQGRVLAAVTARGVAASDVQTVALSFQPAVDYVDGAPRRVGFVASNLVRVRICDLSKVSEVVDAAVHAGGDDVRMDGLSFELADDTTIRTRAREAAVADARRRAETLARSLGVRVGPPLAIDEVSGGSGPVFRQAAYADRAEAAPTPVAPGVVSSQVDVTVRFELR